jgi:hypothetical protein
VNHQEETCVPAISVPYDADGNLLHNPGPAGRGWAHQWRPNDVFECTLAGPTVTRSGGIGHVEWRSAEGRIFPMFVTDLVEMINRADILGGSVQGRWIVRKRGQCYGLAYADGGDQ